MKFDEIAWTVAEEMHDNKPVIIRFRNLNQTFPRNSYPQRLNIFWTFSMPTELGLPSPDDSSKAQLFEDRLIEAVETEGHAILSMVLTGKGQREFVFHAFNVNEFLQRLTQMLQEKERYPIEINFAEDVEWDYVDRVLGEKNEATNGR